MNVFQMIFWLVWFASAGYLLHQFRRYIRRRKNGRICANCAHYEEGACKELRWLREQDLPLPLCCCGFERKERKKGKRNTKPGHRGADPEEL